MIMLQSIEVPLEPWRILLQDINQIAQIIGVVMVLIYVIYTYKTFRQIKKQTDYQQDAFLVIETQNMNEISEPEERSAIINRSRIQYRRDFFNTKYLIKDIPSKMYDILKPIFNFEDNLFEGNFFTVNLINYGSTEIKLTALQMSVTIQNSPEVAEKKMLREKETYKVKVDIPEIISRNGGKLIIPLISTASFPIYSISVKGEYFDVRNKKYNISEIITNGENKHFHKLT